MAAAKPAVPFLPASAWLIGGLQFVPTDEHYRRFGDEYESVPLDSGRDVWSVRLTREARGTGDSVSLDLEHRKVVVCETGFSGQSEAVQEAVHRTLVTAGRLPLHAALVVPSDRAAGTLILGDSGKGKSSLTWLALSIGWQVVSDDLVAVRTLESGETVGATVRKKLRIDLRLLDARARALGRRMQYDDATQKVRLDPEVYCPGSFVREARIDRMAFLEHSKSRTIRAISRSETLERLLTACAPALSSPGAKAAFEAVTSLARNAQGRVVGLTRECLSDPRVLEELAS